MTKHPKNWYWRTAVTLGMIFGFCWLIGGLIGGLSEKSGIGEFIMRLIPGATIILTTTVAWKWGLFGGILLLLEGLIALWRIAVMVVNPTVMLVMVLTLSLPLIFSGFLFMYDWKMDLKKKVIPVKAPKITDVDIFKTMEMKTAGKKRVTRKGAKKKVGKKLIKKKKVGKRKK